MNRIIVILLLILPLRLFAAMSVMIPSSSSPSAITSSNSSWTYSNTMGFSAGGWFYVTNNNPTGDNGAFFSKTSGPTSPTGWFCNFRATAARRLQFQLYRNGTALLVATQSNGCPAFEWFHLCLTYSRVGNGSSTNNIKIYTNGVENTSRNQLQNGAADAMDDPHAQFRINSSQGSGAPSILRCNYDEVFFTTNVLSPEQVAEIVRGSRHMKYFLPQYLGNALQIYCTSDWTSLGREVVTNYSVYEATGRTRSMIWDGGWRQLGLGSFRTYP